MKKFNFIALILLTAWMSSCVSSNVTVEEGANGEFDLQNYSSYEFLDVEVENSHNEDFKLAVDFLKDEINKQLSAQGLAYKDDGAELQINLGIVVEEKEQTRTTNLATDPFMYTGQRRYTWQSEEIVVNKYKEGSLTMHLVDSESNQAVWVGMVSKIIPSKTEKKQQAIADAVNDIFQEINKTNN
ncbi:DUF4136 domain-containing protein [Algoriphagus halophytocola]|uniref:DUF4136 domain-containing protein n=1 Tax=Algoriphagus halophytocola TaxID=2991499 RepID=UPI0022DD93A9|nr:DUF4136 domain-containing protein [Algoriphagus sp. TR-M9]WBL44288.1 DUF4136 domain-containing protein [Algoriphagus sp. TR-M9]